MEGESEHVGQVQSRGEAHQLELQGRTLSRDLEELVTRQVKIIAPDLRVQDLCPLPPRPPLHPGPQAAGTGHQQVHHLSGPLCGPLSPGDTEHRKYSLNTFLCVWT